MATETSLGTMHVFPNITSYNNNKTSVGTSDLAIVPTFGGSVVEHYVNGTNWYRVWSNGWLEQGGVATSTNITVTFLKAFRNNQYTLVFGNTNGDESAWLAQKTTGNGNYFTVVQTKRIDWRGWVAFGWKA